MERLALGIGASDILVLQHTGDAMHLIGGHGRGAGWAGNVVIDLAQEPAAAAAIRTGRPVRITGMGPQRIVGPYWCVDATILPVGDEHLVVAGGTSPPIASKAEMVRYATEAVASCGHISSEKLLADELEVVHAVRALMDCRPTSVVEAARHVAAVAAESLSCEIGAVLMRFPDRNVVGVSRSDGAECADDEALCAELNRLTDRIGEGMLLEQEVPPPREVAGIELVSRMALTIGREHAAGLLLVGHARPSPRGFTSLCQRLGRSVADAAELILEQAMAHERLASQRDIFAAQARTDGLTGLGNRTAWAEAVNEAEAVRDHAQSLAVMMVDLDHLKHTNDQYGHAAGDKLLIAAADVLRMAVGDGGTVVRLGGDEFAVLMVDADLSTALGVAARVQAAAAKWQDADGRLQLRLSTGCAVPAPDESLDVALARADALLGSAKRTR